MGRVRGEAVLHVFTYDGDVKEEGFLKMLSELVGQYRYTSVSASRQQDSRSTSRQDSTDHILSVADLAAMFKGRAIVLGSGSRAVLLRTVSVSDRSYADKIAASEAAHDAVVITSGIVQMAALLSLPGCKPAHCLAVRPIPGSSARGSYSRLMKKVFHHMVLAIYLRRGSLGLS